MSRFSSEKSEVVLAKTQCDVCIHNKKEDPVRCEKYDPKPEEVLNNKKACPFLRLDGEIDL